MKTKITFLSLAGLLIFSVITLTACRKKNPIFTHQLTHQLNHKVSNNNGILRFDDRDDFNAFLDYLSRKVISDTTDKSDTLDYNDKLQMMEDSLDFHSLRAELHSRALAAQDDGTFSPDNDPEVQFIADPILRSVLNPDLQVQIEDTFYVFLDKNYMAATTDENSLETIPKDVYSAGFIKGVTIIPLQPLARIEFIRSSSGNMIVTATPNSCDGMSFTFNARVASVYSPGDVTFYWQLGQPANIVLTTFQGANSLSSTSVSYSYTTPGSKPFNVTGVGTNGATLYPTYLSSISADANCIAAGSWYSVPVWYYPVVGHAMKCEQWTSNYNNNAWQNHTIGGKTTHYELKNNSWKEKKAGHISVQVFGYLNKTDCVSTINVAVADWEIKSKTANDNHHIGESYVIPSQAIMTIHQVEIDGNYFTENIYFPPSCQ